MIRGAIHPHVDAPSPACGGGIGRGKVPFLRGQVPFLRGQVPLPDSPAADAPPRRSRPLPTLPRLRERAIAEIF